MSKPYSLKRFFQDKDGNIVVLQQPNAPLLLWAILRAVSVLIDQEQIRTGLEYLSTALLFTWAYMELTNGASPFRRSLGAVVIGFIIIGFFVRFI